MMGDRETAGGNGAAKRALFISHRHADKDIADVIREFVEGWTGGRIEVFQSSSTQAAAPRIGRRLSDELKQALRDASVVLFLHTRANDDWSTCMWEIGVATDPDKPDTKVVLLACGDIIPVVFDDQVRVNLRKLRDVQRFVNGLLTDPQFFPSFLEPATEFAPKSGHIDRATQDLVNRLAVVLPPAAEEPDHVSWPYPFMRLQLTLDHVKSIQDTSLAERLHHTVHILEDSALVLEGDYQAGRVFGVQGEPRSILLKKLITAWRERTATPSSEWIEGLACQVMDGAMGQFPTLRWELMRGADRQDGTWYAPVVTRVRKCPEERVLEFDVALCKFALDDRGNVEVGVPTVDASSG